MDKNEKPIVDLILKADELWYLANIKKDHASRMLRDSVMLFEKANKLYTKALKYKKISHFKKTG